jgi:hypothetical protein
MKLFHLFPPLLDLRRDGDNTNRHITALHSGNLGDIIYSLPTAFALRATHFVLNVCTDPTFGNRALTADGATKLAPLLLRQGSIDRVSVIQSNVPWEFAPPRAIGVDYVLDAFRCDWTDNTLHLIHRHALPFGIRVRGDRNWIASEPLREGDLPSDIEQRYLVVALTRRYRCWDDDAYITLLRDIPPEHVVYIGIEQDLTHKVNVPGLYLRVVDFEQLARILSGAALFIGNPSFPYSLAEALKVPRMVELPKGINVAPLDSSGLALHMYSFEFLRARIFEALALVSTDATKLKQQLHTADSRIAELLETRDQLEQKIKLLTNRLNCLAAQDKLVVAHRPHVTEVPRTESALKRLCRRTLLATESGRHAYRAAARVDTLRRLWRRLG